jgi:hypothetical protein
VIQEPRFQNSSGEAGRGRWCPSVECGIEHIFVFVGSLLLSRGCVRWWRLTGKPEVIHLIS